MKDLNMHFENLMGSQRWSKITNTVLNQMSHLIFDHVKYSLLDELESDIKKHLNQQLSSLPADFVTKRSESLFDGLVEKLGKEISRLGYDPLKLEDQKGLRALQPPARF